MTYLLTISSQGQIVVPKKIRQAMGLTPGSKVRVRLDQKLKTPTAVIEPEKIDWVKRTAGIAKGIYGKGEEYIENERKSWDR